MIARQASDQAELLCQHGPTGARRPKQHPARADEALVRRQHDVAAGHQGGEFGRGPAVYPRCAATAPAGRAPARGSALRWRRGWPDRCDRQAARPRERRCRKAAAATRRAPPTGPCARSDSRTAAGRCVRAARNRRSRCVGQRFRSRTAPDRAPPAPCRHGCSVRRHAPGRTGRATAPHGRSDCAASSGTAGPCADRAAVRPAWAGSRRGRRSARRDGTSMPASGLPARLQSERERQAEKIEGEKESGIGAAAA